MSNPLRPSQVASLTTDRIQPSYYGYYGGYYGEDCWDCGYGGYYYYGGNYGEAVQAIDDALVFLTRHQGRVTQLNLQ